MDYQSSNIVGDNLKNSSLSGLMEYALSKAGVHNQPITSSPKHYAGSSLVEYAILKAGGQNTREIKCTTLCSIQSYGVCHFEGRWTEAILNMQSKRKNLVLWYT